MAQNVKAGDVVHVSNPDSSVSQAADITLDADGKFSGTTSGKAVATLTGNGTGYASTAVAATVQAATTGSAATSRTGAIPQDTDLSKALAKNTKLSANFDQTDNLYSVKDGDKYNIYDATGKELKKGVKADDVIQITNPDTSIGQASYIYINGSGQFTGASENIGNKSVLTLTGNGTGYLTKQEEEDANTPDVTPGIV